MIEDKFVPNYEFGSDIETPSPPKSKKPPKVKKANHVLCAWQNILMLSGILSEIIYLGMLHHRHVVHFVNFGQAHFLDLHNQKNHNNNYTSQHLDIFWVDFMFGLLLRIIQIRKLENFENLYKFINNNERFERARDQCLVMKIQ